MKTPEILVIEALMAVCGQMARVAGPTAAAASSRLSRLAAEHSKLCREAAVNEESTVEAAEGNPLPQAA